jgi:spermidine/putrescine transport system ATP-binding protein
MTNETDSGHFVDIRNASKTFITPEGQPFKALDNLTLHVHDNEFVTLLGPSGCGKTTLLRTLSGLEHLEEGEIWIDGRPMAGIPPHRRPVNTVFQSYALFPHLTVGGNVGYSLDVAGVKRDERNRRIARALELVGLQGMERRKPRQLSGGQQQRVALARAIIGNPKLLLLDEPLAALDRGLRQNMQIELKNIQNELGISFVFVTHDQEEALTMSDRIVVMKGGHIIQIGTPSEIYEHPHSEFVAGFVGESNLFSGTLQSVDNEMLELLTEEGETVRLRAGPEDRPGEQAMVLIRPERFYLHTGERPGDADQWGWLTATLRQSVFLGTDYQLICELPSGYSLRAFVREADHEAVKSLGRGDEITFRYSLSAPVVVSGEDAP